MPIFGKFVSDWIGFLCSGGRGLFFSYFFSRFPIVCIGLLIAFGSPAKLFSYSRESVPDYCKGRLDLETIILCTLDYSPEYKISKQELESLKGRRRVEEYFFPSNPVISVMGSERRIEEGRFPPTGVQTVINGEILFSQEIYIGGKRQARVSLVDRQIRSAIYRIQAVERATIDEAIRATYHFQMAWEEYQLSEEYFRLSEQLVQVAKKRFQLGLGPEIDLELADVDRIQAKAGLEASRRNLESAITDLVVMMGIPYPDNWEIFPKNPIFPDLPEETREDFVAKALVNRPDLEALEWDRRVAESRITVLQKEKVPNLTISGFVQNDGFNERVIGARITLPLPLSRDNSGEILEARSEKVKGEFKKEVGEHTVRSEAIKAWNALQSWKRVYREYNEEMMKKSVENLKILSQAVEKGNLSVREAILLKRPFLDYRNKYIQAKLGYALALSEYLRAGGIPYSSYLRREKQTKEK